MANARYDTLRDGLMDASINLSTDTLYIVPVTSSYVYSAAHATMEDANVPTANRVAAAVPLVSRTVTAGVLNASNTTFGTVDNGTIDAYIVFKYDTSETSPSSIPLLYIDTTSDASLPLVTNGGEVIVNFHDTNGMYKLP